MATPAFAIRQLWDSRDVKANLLRLSAKGWTFSTAVALSRTGKRVKEAERAAMSVFDRPTPFTTNSLYNSGATPSRLQAEVWFKDFAPKGTPAGKYLLPQVNGGERDIKRFEKALQYAGWLPVGCALVPASGAALDAYGNVSRGLIVKILSQLGANSSGANEPLRLKKKRNATQQRGRYFYGNPGHKGEGIWERISFGFGSAVRPVFITVKRRPTYHAIFPFFDIGERVTQEAFPEEFGRAADERLK